MRRARSKKNVPRKRNSAALVAMARRAASLRVTKSVPEGVQDEVLYTYDLELPSDFRPINHDGEVAEFRLVTPDELMVLLAAREFTVDAGVVAIDFLSRRGALPADIRLEQQLGALRVTA